MPLFKKAILKVGDHFSPDGVVSVTPERVRHWAATHKKMVEAGLAIPIGIDHADDPKKSQPLSRDKFDALFSTSRHKKRSAIDAIGDLHAVELSKDGQSAELTLNIKDPEAVRKAKNNVVEISPVIFETWRDGKNKVWKDCFTHVDFVLHPVDHGQTPFEEVPGSTFAQACSLRMGLESGEPKTYRMAEDVQAKFPPLKKTKKKKSTDVGEDADDTEDGEESAADETSDSDIDGDPGADETTETPGDMDGDEDGDEDEDEGTDMPDDSSYDDEECRKACMARLLEFGIALPDDTDEKSFCRDLLTALKTAEATKNLHEQESKEDDEDTDMTGAANATPHESSPAFAAMGLKIKEAQKQAASAHHYAERQYRLGISQRLSRLRDSGRCTPAEYDKASEPLKAVKLSLDANGEPVRSDLEKFIESREALPAGCAWEPEERSKRMAGPNDLPSEAPAPKELFGDDELTDDEAEEVVDNFFRRKRREVYNGK